MTAPRLFHFTCLDHGYPKIGARGFVVPQQHRTLAGIPHIDIGVAWFTAGDFASTGMGQSDAAVCDRSAYRYVVSDASRCVPWLGSQYRDAVEDTGVLDGGVFALELLGDPSQWWVSPDPVPVRLG